VLIKPPSGWLPVDSSILISILKATDNNDFPFFSQPFSGMTDELTSFPNILLSAHSLSLYLNKDVIPSEFLSQCGPCGLFPPRQRSFLPLNWHPTYIQVQSNCQVKK
jgi:hypothetical protein